MVDARNGMFRYLGRHILFVDYFFDLRFLVDIVSLHNASPFYGYVYGACRPSGIPRAQ